MVILKQGSEASGKALTVEAFCGVVIPQRSGRLMGCVLSLPKCFLGAMCQVHGWVQGDAYIVK